MNEKFFSLAIINTHVLSHDQKSTEKNGLQKPLQRLKKAFPTLYPTFKNKNSRLNLFRTQMSQNNKSEQFKQII